MLVFETEKDISDFVVEINSNYPIQKGYGTLRYYPETKRSLRATDNKFYCCEPRELLIPEAMKSKYTKEKFEDSWVAKESEISLETAKSKRNR